MANGSKSRRRGCEIKSWRCGDLDDGLSVARLNKESHPLSETRPFRRAPYVDRTVSPSGAVPMVHVIATIQLQPGRRDAFLAEFHKLVPLVRAEDGCLEYGPAVDILTGIPVQDPVRDDA